MYIRKLILNKYKRLFLNNIDRIEYTPFKPIQIITGVNGGGKSSLLRELNPLPADVNSEYYEDGYKYIEIVHNGSEYILSSGYIGKGKHSFVKDGVELNNGGTKKVQSILVNEYFNITNSKIEILLGNVRFTNMGPSVRKHWFTELSSIDYSYAISMYNTLRDRYRDIVGAIKLLQDNIAKNESTILSKLEIDKIELDISKLEEYITYTVSLYDHTVKDINFLNIEEDIVKVVNIVNRLRELNDDDRSIVELDKELNRINIELDSLDRRIKDIKSSLDKLDTVCNSNENIVDVEKMIYSKNEELKEIKDSIYIDIDNEYLSRIEVDMSDVIANISPMLTELVQYEDIRAINNKDSLLLAKELSDSDLYLKSIAGRVDRIRTEIEHIEKLHNDDNRVTCTECKHSWFLGYDDIKLKELKASENKLLKEYTERKAVRDILNEKVDRVTSKNDIVNNILNYIKLYPSLREIWIHFLKNNSILTTPLGTITSELNRLIINIERWSKIPKIELELKELNMTLSNLKNIEDVKLMHNVKKIDELEKQLEELVKDSNQHLNNKEIITKKIKIKNLLKEQYDKLNKLLLSVSKSRKEEYKKIRNEYLSKLTIELRKEYMDMKSKLNESISSIDKIRADKDTLASYKEREVVLSNMVKELSPKDGLIAKSINSFLNLFIMDMNSVINSIWSYPMEILPFEINEEDSLDYKFSVKVNNDEIIGDVSKLSSSMQEIVDLAYRIVFIKYGKIDYVPLYLDEFGRTFDKNHRIAAYDVIDKIISSDFKQIFLVSHFETMYGSLQNSDLIIINSDTNRKYDETDVFKIF